jgi:hypothetical protein
MSLQGRMPMQNKVTLLVMVVVSFSLAILGSIRLFFQVLQNDVIVLHNGL